MSASPLAQLFYAQFYKIHQKENVDYLTKITELNNLLTRLFFELTKNENVPLSTMFARISFVCHKHQVSRAVQWRIHQLRAKLKSAQSKSQPLEERDYLTSLKTVVYAVAALCHTSVPPDLRDILLEDDDDETDRVRMHAKGKMDSLRVFVVENEVETHTLLAKPSDNPSDIIRVRYNQIGYNENFNSTIHIIINDFQCKATVNLVDIIINEDGEYLPKIFVLEPDYLVDVTSVAECFQGAKAHPLYYLLKKFMPMPSTKALMMGNVANFFLDELMTNPQADFDTTFLKTFQINPISFALFEDMTVREIYSESKRHFVSLQRLLHEYFEEKNINKDDCFLEPSFYSELYGLQGRLDVWQRDHNTNQATIIELKSGKPYMPNRYQISNNHFMQTVLYDLLVSSVYKNKLSASKYIFYSALDVENLKFAPAMKQQEYEAIKVRNELISIEKRLASIDKKSLEEAGVLDRIAPESVPSLTGFASQDFAKFAECFQYASDLERRYFRAFVSFIAREHQLARTGVEGNDNINGIASLWLDDLDKKERDFQVLGYLKVEENHANDEAQTIVFLRTARTQPLANFREGDIVVLYPRLDDMDSALTSQIFKGSLQELTPESVVMRLNSRQFNTTLFEQNLDWFIEHDMMDKGYLVQYQALYTFIQSKKYQRDLLLTLCPPACPTNTPTDELEMYSTLLQQNPKASEEQIRILTKALLAKDYFLLIGPPGTGKTKYMLAEMVRYILNNTQEHILLLAYTNRAVDEICEAIHNFAKDQYIRIGSRSASNEHFKDQLFQNKIQHTKKRKELVQIAESHRIFVSTIASIANNPLILKLKRFDTAIIDEASQVLEPVLIGMLPSFKRFILIGDDKQLPAVVLQDKETSKLEDAELAKIGLSNRRNSLFERLLKRVQENQWEWAFDMLSHQGRMHSDICEFPSHFFYQDKLKLLPQQIPSNRWQCAPLSYELPPAATELQHYLVSKRVLYFPTAVDSAANTKVNAHEAKCIAEIVRAFYAIYQANNMEMKPETIGVITPYRAQIAQIRHELAKDGEGFENCTIDTVERYQGGARDIILISLCLNAPYQLETLVSLDDTETVDRKLNVALTRARQHLIVVGNEALLSQDPRYKSLIDWIRGKKISN